MSTPNVLQTLYVEVIAAQPPAVVVEVITPGLGGSGIADAPADGKQYARQDNAWVEVMQGVFTDYTFSTTVTPAPAAGQIRLNNAAQDAATLLWVNYVTSPGVDIQRILLSLISTGSLLVLQDKDDSTCFVKFSASDVPRDMGSYLEVPVSFVQGGNPVAKNQRVLFAFR